MSATRSKVLLAMVCVAVGLIAGRLLSQKPVFGQRDGSAGDEAVEPAGSGSGAHSCALFARFPLLAAPAGCRGAPLRDKSPLFDLEAALKRQLDGAQQAGEVTRAAFYIRDLEDGPVVAVHQDEPFAPASLLKLPVAMSIYDFAAEEPSVLVRKVTYAQSAIVHFPVPEQHFPFRSDLVPGSTVPLRELVRSALTYSDNIAFLLLLEQLNYVVPEAPAALRRSFQELGVIDPPAGAEDVLTVHNYASLFRSLYRASYLSQSASQELLGWMAASPFDVGLAAGLPKGVTLAHKFGERGGQGNTKQLHDCGIVYLPGNPYQICVMSEGPEWAPLERFIATASSTTFQALSSRR